MKIALLVHDIYEDLELWYPKYRLEEAGHIALIAGPVAGQTYKGKHGYPAEADIPLSDLSADQFDGVVIPGGFSPDKLRRDPKLLEFIKELDQKKKMIASICHGGWLLASAKIIKGRQVTSTVAIKDDLENAGASWLDQDVVVDRNLICSRTPKDLPAFAKAIIAFLG